MGAEDALEWAHVLCGCHIQNYGASRAMNLCLKLELPSIETVQMVQKATAKGNWWLAASSQQHTRSCITPHTQFFGKTLNHPGDSVPLSPDLAPCDFWIFPTLKSPLKRDRFLTIDEIQENMTGPLMVIGRTVWGPKVPILKWTEASLSYVQCFLCLVSLSVSVSIFHITWLDTFWVDLIEYICFSLIAVIQAIF